MERSVCNTTLLFLVASLLVLVTVVLLTLNHTLLFHCRNTSPPFISVICRLVAISFIFILP